MAINKTILIADDDATLLLLLKFRFEEAGYTVYTANNGEEALKTFEEKTPHIMVTDIMMPKFNGIEVLETIRSKNTKTPIILLSNAGQEEIILKAFNIGVTDFLSKPFIVNELIVRVKKYTTGII